MSELTERLRKRAEYLRNLPWVLKNIEAEAAELDAAAEIIEAQEARIDELADWNRRLIRERDEWEGNYIEAEG